MEQQIINASKIQEAKNRLVDEFGIETDRDLFAQLGITDNDDKRKIFAWITYQNAFSYREGFDDGQDSLRDSLQKLLTSTR